MNVISFDLDGTLVKMDFVDAVWLEEIPREYAKKNGMSFEEAKRYIEEEYLKIGPEAIEWYDINYWLNKFNLKMDYKEIFKKCRDKLGLYEDALKALEMLKGRSLIIISNAALEFIEFELNELGLKKYFSHVFSAVNHFNKTKKDSDVYRQVCKKIGIECDSLIHVGDNYEFDYIAATNAGATAYYLDRHENENGEHVVYSLVEFAEKVIK